MSFEDPIEVKNWKREKVLGSGGFGTVTLWKQKDGDRMIALKKCRCGADSLLTPKQKERWKKEVEIMQRLNHENVVRALPLPEDLASIPSILPILCMEYCSKGDLRQVLNRPENSCGLQEGDVRRLIQNVASAVSYLHSEKITHRDLKPENIVLAQGDSGIIYKLIDLGYAKELDQSSCTSFVGTLQYLAPELYTNEKYTSSVDYWSLGLVSHEVITGLRPFLPNMAPGAWMKHVRRKAPEHICCYQNPDGKIEFSSHLFPQNHISSVLCCDMENWLRLILEWNPKKRGRSADGRVIVFTEIESILAKQVIRVFCMTTYERLSYAVGASTPLSLLKEWIENDTKIPAREQELLLASGQQIDVNGLLNQCLSDSSAESLYVVKRGTLELPAAVPPRFPDLVAYILQSPRDKMEYFHQRRAYSHAVFFLQQENKLYKSFLVGCKLKLLSVVLRCQKVVRESQKITDQCNAASALKELCTDAYKFDSLQAKKAKITSMVSSWHDQMENLNSKYVELHNKTQILTAEAQKVTRLARKLQASQPTNMKEDPKLNSYLGTGLDILDKLRRRPTAERSSQHDSLEMVKVLYNFLKQRDCLLLDQTLNSHLKQLIDCESELVKLMPKLEDMSNRLDVLKHDMIAVNRERQRSVWDFLLSSLADGHSSHGGSPSNPIHYTCPSDSYPFLYRSLSSRSLSSENHVPAWPSIGSSASALCTMAASSSSLCNAYSPSLSQSSLTNPLKSSQPTLDVSDAQQPPCSYHLSSETDSGIVGCLAKISLKGSSSPPHKQSGDCNPHIISPRFLESHSLHVETQDLSGKYNPVMKALHEDKNSLDWSSLGTDSQ